MNTALVKSTVALTNKVYNNGNVSLDTFIRLGEIFADSGFFSDSKGAAQCVVKMLAGAELGFSPLASMTGIYIINGKVTMGAHLIASKIKRSIKYNYKVTKLDSEGCILTFYENSEIIGESSFDEQDAMTACLLTSKDTWRKFRRNMYFSRAVSNGARWFCADLFGGPVYTPDELGATLNEEGDVIALPEETEKSNKYSTVVQFPKTSAEMPKDELKKEPPITPAVQDSLQKMHNRIVALGGTPPSENDNFADLTLSESKRLISTYAAALRNILINRYSFCRAEIEKIQPVSESLPDLENMPLPQLDKACQEIESQLSNLQAAQYSAAIDTDVIDADVDVEDDEIS
jgi:hypothetical protein